MTYNDLARLCIKEAIKETGCELANIPEELIDKAISDSLVSAEIEAAFEMPNFEPHAEIPADKIEHLKQIGINHTKKQLNEELRPAVDEAAARHRKRI